MSNKNVVNEFFSPDLLGRMHNIDIVLESKLCVNQKVFLHNLRTISKKRRIENAKMIVTRLTYQNLRLIANFAFCIISLSKLQWTKSNASFRTCQDTLAHEYSKSTVQFKLKDPINLNFIA